MESLRRPFLKKKLSNANNNSFSEKNAYDNVFAGGGPRFEAAAYSARIDDYGEIFGGSRASSIPILDVSALDEPKVSADVRSSKLDYSKIFGGFGDCDLGVSYEEMFAKPKGARNFSVGARAPARKVSYSDGSDQLNHYREGATNFSVGTRAPARTVSYSDGSDQLNHYREGATNFSVGSRAPARTVSYSDGSDQLNHYREGATNFSVGGRAPARTVSYSDGSDQLNHSREGAFQNEVPNQSFEGVKQFNASYHKTSLRSDDGKHRTAHIAQLRSVPGFTCFIDENPPVQKKEDKSVPPPKVDVTSPPNVCANSTKKQTFDGMGKFESQSSWNKSHPIDRSFSANEPKTHSSKVSSLSSMPANLISSKSMPTRSMDSNSKVPKNDASKAGPGYCSPSFSDEELDENSAAAASAAALRKALETAQASIRIAKQFMERKKDVTQRFSKPSSKDGLDINDRREDKVALADTRIREKNAKEMSERDDIVFQVFSKGEREKARRSGKVAPDLKATKEIPITKEVVREKNGNQLESAEACGAVKQVSGMENRGECRNATLPCDHDGGKNNITEFVDTHECGMKDMETENEILEQPDGSGKKMDEEARKLEDLPVKLNILEATQDLEQHVGRLDTAQEVQEQEEKEKARVAQVDEETKENQKASIVQGYRENVLEEFLELKENEEFQSQGEKVNNNEEGLNEAQECMKAERKLEDTFGEEQNELLEEFFDLKENEEFESQGVKANSKEEGLAEAQDCMENERNLKDILGEEQNEKLLEEFFDLKENEEFECQGVKVNNSEEGHVEAQECMVDERKLEDICGEEQHDKLLEEFLDLKDNEEFDSQGVKANSNEEGPVEAQECVVNERKLEDISGEEKNEKLLDLKENVEFGTQEMKANDNEGGPFEAQECMENERKLEDIFGEEQNGKLLEEFLDLKENEEFDSQGVKADNYEEGHDEAQECMENERYPEDNFDIKQSEKLKDFHEEENGNGLRNICELNKVEKGLEASGLWTGDEEAFEVESSEKGQHDACEGDDNEKSVDKIHEPDISNKRFSDTTDGEESPEKQEGNSDFAGNENILVDECEETESIQRETEGSEMTEVNQEAVEETMNLDATINACEWEEGENVNESEEVHIHKQNDYDLHFEENERISDATQSSWEFTSDENGLEAAEMAHELGGKESCNSAGLVGDAAEHVEMENTMKDGSEALYFNDNPANTDITDTSFGAKQTYRNEKESESTSTVGSGIKASVCDSAIEGEKEANEEVVFAQEEVKNNIDTVHVRRARKQWFETGKKMEPSQPPSVFEGEEKTIRIDEEIKTNQIVDEVVKSNLDTAHERRARKQWFETGKKTEPSQPPIYKGEEKTVRIDEEIKTNQFTEKNVDNLAKTPAVEEKETKETEQKEVKKDYLRKIDEAYKRERERERDRMAVERAEREKDRMAVERAIREARERAFAEARERAERAAVERATAEARKRVMAEAREKLEKASAATKSSAEKASMEAKLRAERAAVERATVEARERALEKALSQKATSGARELSDRYVVEKVSGVSRESGTRQSFSSSDIQKLNEHNGESAERRKARLERNQRTMERAAKALAEKNRRDLLAQKEQAERNRYAETLDAEVKRWSSGKEGNLRALLSTLQYILGTNSGWQPVSLTEIVTTTAVKKAYRKATLHVHPDKLQQRGATIQQKYVCEKVFDLLKAAWNKFNSEER